MTNQRFKRWDGTRRDISGAGIYGNAIRWIANAADSERPACVELLASLYCVQANVVEAHVFNVRQGWAAPKGPPRQTRAANA